MDKQVEDMIHWWFLRCLFRYFTSLFIYYGSCVSNFLALLPTGHAGEDDILHQHTEAEAYDGNAHAQTWLAKKYYWGFGGVEQNEQLAR